MEKEYYLWAFQIDKKRLFNVRYTKTGGNITADFATSASVFNQPKTDFNRCGQCQNDVLPKTGLLHKFYTKWDTKHLQDLNDNEYLDLLKDIEELKASYNFIEIKQPATHSISFWRLKELSKQSPRKIKGEN